MRTLPRGRVLPKSVKVRMGFPAVSEGSNGTGLRFGGTGC